MKGRKSVSACLLGLIFLGVMGNFPFFVRAHPTFSVSEDDDYIRVENDYYIANVSKARGWLGKFFAIKPYDTVNIVTSWSGSGLGLHEREAYNGSDSNNVAQWDSYAGAFKLYETSIVYQTSEVAVVYTKFKCNGTSPPPDNTYNITEWKVFYADKPYMLVSFNFVPWHDMNWQNEQQVCFLFDRDWVSDVRNTDLNGDMSSSTTTKDTYSFMSKGMEKFPWWYFHNSTYGTGFGTILLNSYPNDARIGHYFDSAGMGYEEYQITQNSYTSGLKGGESNVVTYINYVASNETDVDDFSQQLYKSMHTTVDASYYPTSNSYLHPSYGGFKKSGVLSFQFLNNYIILWSAIYGDSNGHRCRPYFQDTSEHGLWGSLASASIPYWYWNTTYSKMTYRRDYESKLRWEITIETWANSDIVKVMYNWTTLATMEIKKLYVAHRELYPYANSEIIRLSIDIIKINASSAYTNWIEDNGLAFKNMSGMLEISGSFVYSFALRDSTPQEYEAGTSWTTTLYLQTFCLLDKDFEASDFLDLHQEAREDEIRFDNWIPLPFPDVPSDNGTFRVNYLGHEDCVIATSSYSNDALTITTVGVSRTSSTYKVYCGSKGEPTSVTGATSSSYDSTTEILTLTAIHTGPTTITISWVAEPVTATIDIDPDTLNLKSKRKWITAYIELREGYDVSDIDISTVRLDGEIQVELHQTKIGDYDADGVSDLMVRFDRQDVIALLSAGEATLTITGKVNETPFEGTDTIRVIGKRTK